MINSHFGAAAQHTDLCKAQPVKRIEQEPAALGLGTGVQNSHQLMQRFHAAKVFLRRFAVDPYTLGGNDVLVKLPAIPMPPLFMEQVLRFMIGPVEKMSKVSGIGENKLRELMDNGELEYVQNGNRRLIADTAIWDWYERAKTAVKPPAEQGG